MTEPGVAGGAFVTEAPPASAEARVVLTAYFHDVVSRHYRREATEDEVSAAMSAEPNDDLRPPDGLFFLARQDGAVIGCVGLRLVPGEAGVPGRIGEITRMFVAPQARRQGVGRQLLQSAEQAAGRYGVTRLRLDTGSHLTEARQLYVSHGYREVARFNAGRIADRWYEKTLRDDGDRPASR